MQNKRPLSCCAVYLRTTCVSSVIVCTCVVCVMICCCIGNYVTTSGVHCRRFSGSVKGAGGADSAREDLDELFY